MNPRHVLPFAPAVAAVVLFGLGFVNIYAFAVDIPYWDEWEYLAAPHFTSPSLSWLFVQHNEHRIVLTRLLALFAYHLDGWNLRHQIFFNYVLYGGMLLWLTDFCRRLSPDVDARVWPAFTLFLLAPTLKENLLWGFQSQFHLCWFFALITVSLLFTEDLSPGRFLAAAFAATLSIFSFSGGVVMVVGVAATHTLYRLVRAKALPIRRQRELILGASFLGVVAVALTAWFTGYFKPPGHPALTLPTAAVFWVYLVNLVSWGFGFDRISSFIGWLVVFAVAFPLLATLFRDTWTSPKPWAILAAVLAVVGFLASVAMGRAGFGVITVTKTSRYGEIAALLLPLAAAAWGLYLRDQQGRRTGALLLLWLVAFFAYRDNWGYARIYGPDSEARRRGVACVAEFFQRGGDGNCPDLYPAPIPDRLRQAKELGVSFTRETAAKRDP